MNAGIWILLVLLAVAGVIGRRLHRYPGGWKYAFAPEHDAARRDLGTARDTLRDLKRSAQKELAGARASAEAAATAHRRRVREAEEHLAYLREPGRGGFRAEIDGLSLYEHVLAVNTDDWRGDLPLHDISVRSDHSPTAGHVYLVAPNGRQHLLTYPVADIGEEYVRRFVVDVHNAVSDAKAFQQERASLIRQAGADLRRIRSDTGERAEAELRLGEVTARQGNDIRIPRARQDLDAAQDRWHALTGHRPH
ncbi:hypothetical protein [Kitasatospora sp. NPDC057223]|uniref:hypothetical protein n=1 Tax=Kitasatospora sp. NPDC057223 TaxID=3346055 RepID=UPI00362D1D2D